MTRNNPQSPRRWASGLRILIATLIMAPPQVWANPSGGTVASGTSNISSSGSTLTVQQLSNLAILNWHDFSINSGELTKFIQPSALSAALNRVTGGNPSAILGTLQANGRIYLINPNGVTVGPTGVINTQSFVASSLDVTNSAFLAGGDLLFSGNSLAGVTNAGHINALGGDILLVAHTVQNTGSLSASGTAGMAAGSEVLFTATGNQRVFVQAGSGSAATGVDQKGQIQAATAELAAAGGNIYALAVNNGGSVQATGVNNVGGHIFLTAAGGAVANSAQLAATGQGGQVTVTGGQISLGGNVTSNGAQAYVGPVLLTANDSLTGTGISFKGTVDGAKALTLNPGKGSAVFDGAVGGKTPLTALTVTGATDEEGGAITTSGDQTFNGAFIANPSAVLTSQAGNLDFNGAVNVGNNLTTNSAQFTAFNGPVFLGGSLTSNITSPTGSINLLYSPLGDFGTITSGGDQTYNGPVFIGGAMDVSSLFGNLTFNGPLNGISATQNGEVEANLITNSAWNTSFNGLVTMGTLTSNITGPGAVSFNHGSVTTVFDQTYNGTVNAQQDTTLTSNEGNLVFNGPVNAGFNLTTNSTQDTDFNGPVFIGSNLVAQSDQGRINLGAGSITSGGDQTYTGPISLTADNDVSSLYGNLNFNGTVDGGHALTTNSDWNTNFNRAVGGGSPLEALTSNIIAAGQVSVNGGPGHINIDGGSLVTSGDQTYNGPVYAQPDTVLTSNAGNLNFNQTVNAGNSLTTNSALNTNFNGAVFLGDALTSNITSPSGSIIFNGTSSGDSVISGGDQTYNGPIVLKTPMTINSLFGNLTFNGGILSGLSDTMICDSDCSLTTNSAWNTTFNAPGYGSGFIYVGALTSTAREFFLDVGNIGNSGGPVTFNGPVMLTGDFATGGDTRGVIFNGTVDGGYNFVVGEKVGVTFNAAVGSITPLASLYASNEDGGVNIYGGSIRTVGDQSYGNPEDGFFLNSDTTLTSTAGNVNFVNSVYGAKNLTTSSYLNTNFYGPVGSPTPLQSLTANITGPGGIYLHGNTVTTTGSQTYNGPVTK